MAETDSWSDFEDAPADGLQPDITVNVGGSSTGLSWMDSLAAPRGRVGVAPSYGPSSGSPYASTGPSRAGAERPALVHAIERPWPPRLDDANRREWRSG